MNDRDDYPDNPYRGRNERERGYDYDPLSDPLPAQPPSRGRRARPEPTGWNDGPADPGASDTGTGGYRRSGEPSGESPAPRRAPRGDGDHDPLGDAPPPGRRRRAEAPAEPPSGQSRRTGAADALRGGRAARSGANRSRGDAPPSGDRPRQEDPAPRRRPDADPTQDALAALANLGAPSTPPGDEPPRQERPDAGPPPRRGRRPQDDPEPAPRRRRGAPAEEGSADTGAVPVEEEPAGRRGRRKRGRRDDEPTGGFLDDAPEDTGAFADAEPTRADDPADSGALPAAEASPGRRGGRRRRGAPAEEGPADTGAVPVEEEPAGRRGRRKRGRRDDEPTGGFLDDAPEDTGAFDSGSFPGLTGSADTGAFAAVPGPTRRRGAGRSRADRADRAEEESRRAPRDPEPEDEPAVAAFDEADEAPRSRRGGRRRRRGAPVEETPVEAAPYADDDEDPAPEPPEEEPEPETGRRGRRKRAADDEDEEPTGRRGRRKRGGRRAEEPEEEPEEYEEPALADIAEAYGGGRSSRKKAKELKRARANANRRGRGRRGGMSKGMMVVLVLLLILVIGGGGYAVARNYVFPPDYTGEGSGEAVFVIASGESGSTIADNLADQGIVASPRAFVNALDAVPADEIGDGLVPGTYGLSEGMSGEAAVAALLDPDTRLGGRVQIREGLRNEQVLEELSNQTGVPLEELQEAHAQTDELGLPDYATGGAAGYLFPATYRFDPDTDGLSMLKTMVTQHRNVTEEMDLEGRASDAGFDPNEIMAMASIIQAESGASEDMPKISRVIYNRLDIDMNLGMDSTCFYAIGTYGIALTNAQLDECAADTSGFDTYHKSGLPPGPFVAPGAEAIEAALEPEEGDWLYFVATDPENGVTEFASTEAEFNVLKERFEETWSGGEE